MKRRVLGRTGMEVSVLGFGGAEIGYEHAEATTVEALLGTAFGAGLNVVDTSACYEGSEELIGKAVSSRRRDFFLFTKAGHEAGLGGEDWEPKTMARTIDRSLERLRTDYVDLIQLHSCDRSVLEQGDVIDVLRRAQEAGKTRFIGYSGENEAADYAVECGAFDTLQTSVNIADQRGIEKHVAAAARAEMGVIAKRPLANVAWRKSDAPASEYQRAYWERLRKLAYPFLSEGLESAVATALKFTLSVPGVCTAIVGTSKPDRWQQNAAMLESGMLPVETYEAIRSRWREVAEGDWRGEV